MTQQKTSFLRKLTKIFLWTLGILAAILVAVYYYLGTLVKGAVNQFLPPITGTTVQVDHVDLSLLSGKIEIRGLEIGNPKGYSSKNIFELGQVKVSFQPKSILSDKIIIDSLLISGTKVSAELKNVAHLESNVSALQKNVAAYAGNFAQDKTNKTVKTAKQEKNSGKSVGIKELQINGTEVALGYSGQMIEIPLPNMEQKNIGMGKKAASFSEVFADILNLISKETLTEISKNASKIASKNVKNIKEILKKNGDNLGGTAKEALGSLKGLF